MASPLPDVVYHYTKKEIALEHILPEMTVQLGSLGKTNDPRETQGWGSGMSGPADKVEVFAPFGGAHKLGPAADACRQNEWWVFCASCDHADLIPPSPDRPDFSDFKYGYARARMWAQYAENHRGICLEFDRLALDEAICTTFTDATVFSGRVEYNDMRSQVSLLINVEEIEKHGMEVAVRNHIRENYEHYFLMKNLDWQAESEFRWLVHLPGAVLSAPRINVSRALRAVIVGLDFPAVYGPTLWKLCHGAEVKVDKMNWWNRVPRREPWRPS